MNSSLLADAGVSDREAEVLTLLGAHRTNAEIAAELFISVRTVESHVSSLLRKLSADDRRALAELAAGLRSEAAEDAAPAEVAAEAPRPLLPAPLTTFIGRAAERDALAEMVAEHRLVTAVGPGGAGKTRLALAVAADVSDRFADGAWFVDLAPVSDPSMVGAAVVSALGLAEQLGRSASDTAISHLGGAESLLVLDNCEHVLDGVVELVERLLSACPRVVVLATSRARLVVPFESVYVVPELSGEDDGDAVSLFLDRAALAGWTPAGPQDREQIAAVCGALDGLALAIELAAARVATLGLDGLEAALGNRLSLLAGGSRAVERQRSVRATLDWSYGLLDPVDQVVLRHTAVFATPFTAQAAGLLVDSEGDGLDPFEVAEALARLADNSLLVVRPRPDGTRYGMLETIRRYGEERLADADERAAVHARHLHWALDTARGVEAEGFEPVADDLRAALRWAVVDAPEERAAAHDLALRMGELTFARGLCSESQRRYGEAAALAADDRERYMALRLSADAALSRLAGDDALQLFREAASVAERAGDQRGAALALARAAELISRSPGLISTLPPQDEEAKLVARARQLAGDDPLVVAATMVTDAVQDQEHLTPELFEEAVRTAEAVDDTRLVSSALDNLTVLYLKAGDIAASAAASRRRLAILEAVPLDVMLAFEVTDAYHMAALTTIAIGDLPAAQAYARRQSNLSFHRGESYLLIRWPLVCAALAGNFDETDRLARQFVVGWEQFGRPRVPGFANVPAAAAMVYGLRGDDAARAEWLAIHAAMRRDGLAPSEADTGYGPLFEALLHLHRGEADVAFDILSRDLGTPGCSWDTMAWSHWHLATRAEAAVLAGRPEAPDHLAEARAVTTANPVASAIVARADALASGDQAALVAAADALAAAGSPYQQARTLILAGPPHTTEGTALMSDLGAAPMSTP